MPLDYTYLPASDDTQDAALMHVSATRSIGATTLEVDTVAGIPTKFIASYGTLLSSGFIDPATVVNFYGHLSGADLEIDDFLPGSVDAGNAEGDVVVIKPNTFWANLVASLLATLPGANIADNSIGLDKLLTGSLYLDSVIRTTDFSTDSSDVVALTGMTVTVDAPTAARIKITLSCSNVRNQVADQTSYLTIWDGPVGTGSLIMQGSFTSTAIDQGAAMTIVALTEVLSGSKTYNVGVTTTGGGTAFISAAPTSPLLLLVEALP